MLSPQIIRPILVGQFYVSCLGALVSAAEQDDNRLPDLAEIKPVARTKIDLDLKDSFSNRIALTQISRPGAGNSRSNLGRPFSVSQCFQPPLTGRSAGGRLVVIRLLGNGLNYVLY